MWLSLPQRLKYSVNFQRIYSFLGYNSCCEWLLKRVTTLLVTIYSCVPDVMAAEFEMEVPSANRIGQDNMVRARKVCS